MMRLEGKTAAGRTVSIEGTPSQGVWGKPHPGDAKVWIDGEEAKIEDVRLYRDGGSRVVETDRGTITMSRRIGREPSDSLDGERLEPLER